MHSKRLREKVKQDYNEIAEEFSKTRAHDWNEFDVFLSYLRPKMRVLDLGCGNARLLNFLDGWRMDYTGFDQSEGLIHLARKKHQGQRLEVQDMADLPDLDEKWDVVFMIASFHHLPLVDQKKTLDWIREHLEPDGALLMTNWNLFQWRFWKAWLKSLFWPKWGFKGLEIPWNHGVKRYYYAFTSQELRGLLQRSGFEILEERNGRNFVTIARV